MSTDKVTVKLQAMQEDMDRLEGHIQTLALAIEKLALVVAGTNEVMQSVRNETVNAVAERLTELDGKQWRNVNNNYGTPGR